MEDSKSDKTDTWVLCKPSLMFESKSWAYLSEVPFKYSTLNISLGWRVLPGTNVLAYYEHSYIMEENSMIRLTPGSYVSLV